MYDTLNYVRIQLLGKAKTERGASAVEYGLLVALIAVIIIAGVTLLGAKVNKIFTDTSSAI